MVIRLLDGVWIIIGNTFPIAHSVSHVPSISPDLLFSSEANAIAISSPSKLLVKQAKPPSELG
jgi:hypothetical protein